MKTIATFDLAEAAFYLHQGLAISAVEIRYHEKPQRHRVRIVFGGDGAANLAQQWRSGPGATAIPVDVKNLLVALGELAGRSL